MGPQCSPPGSRQGPQGASLVRQGSYRTELEPECFGDPNGCETPPAAKQGDHQLRQNTSRPALRLCLSYPDSGWVQLKCLSLAPPRRSRCRRDQSSELSPATVNEEIDLDHREPNTPCCHGGPNQFELDRASQFFPARSCPSLNPRRSRRRGS